MKKDAHKGAGHWQNRAFDIPVPESSREGDMVAEFWRRKGYRVIWKESGHYTHVHVEVPENKAQEFFSGKSNPPRPAAQPTPQPRPAAAKPRPAAAQPRPQPRPAVKPQRVVIGGHTYEYKNGKYYQNGEEISKDLYDAVKRNHPYSFSSTQKPKDYSIAHNMPYNMPGNTFLISYNQPAPQSPQPQPASQSGVLIMNSGKSELNTIKDLTMLALG
jgi:hypothetical protein